MNNAEELWKQVEHMIEMADKSERKPAADVIALQQLRATIINAYALESVYGELQGIRQQLSNLVDRPRDSI